MSEQITWTHVDKLVRKMLDDRMQMACGNTDAEVAYDFVKFLERSTTSLENDLTEHKREALTLKAQLETTREQLAEALTTKPGKTKKRLELLEVAVAELRQHTGML